jgi:hypothetical protein
MRGSVTLGLQKYAYMQIRVYALFHTGKKTSQISWIMRASCFSRWWA